MLNTVIYKREIRDMNNDRIAPLGDLAFKKVLSSNTNKDILTGLIYDFFGFTPSKITIKKPYTIDSYIEELDIPFFQNTPVRKN
jgi:hypothetical protein